MKHKSRAPMGERCCGLTTLCQRRKWRTGKVWPCSGELARLQSARQLWACFLYFGTSKRNRQKASGELSFFRLLGERNSMWWPIGGSFSSDVNLSCLCLTSKEIFWFGVVFQKLYCPLFPCLFSQLQSTAGLWFSSEQMDLPGVLFWDLQKFGSFYSKLMVRYHSGFPFSSPGFVS